MSRRAEIAMSDHEVLDFLDGERTVICATAGRDGWPHLMPLWYVLRDGAIWVWTYGASQKVRNLERDDRATLAVETGSVYEELRGVMFKTHAEIVRDPDRVLELGLALYERHAGAPLDPPVHEAVLTQAPKRVAICFREHSRATWDHRKLG